MTDLTLRMSHALREAQLLRLEASLASKATGKPQAKTETSKAKNVHGRDCSQQSERIS